jgi:hypothetical protein
VHKEKSSTTDLGSPQRKMVLQKRNRLLYIILACAACIGCFIYYFFFYPFPNDPVPPQPSFDVSPDGSGVRSAKKRKARNYEQATNNDNLHVISDLSLVDWFPHQPLRADID